MTFLGLDIGTSSVKALLVDAAQRTLAVGNARLEVARPHPLWSEQDPEHWWQATLAAVAEVRAAAPEGWRALAGIGLSGQMHGATLLDGAGRVLRPAILWNDGRSGAECAELHRLVPDLTARAGNIAMPGFTAPKLLWVRRHEPDGVRGDADRAAAQGLCAPAPDRRPRVGHVGRLRHAVAERRQARLGRHAARRDRPDARSHARSGRRLGGLGDAVGRRSRPNGAWRASRSPAAAATMPPPRSASARCGRARVFFPSARPAWCSR